MIIRGTTPNHIFHIPFSISSVTDAYITYKQDGRVVIDKALKDLSVDLDNNTLSLQLTQDNTMGFCFNHKYRDNIVTIQIKLVFKNNIICLSRPIRDKILDQVRDSQVIVDPSAASLGETVIFDGKVN